MIKASRVSILGGVLSLVMVSAAGAQAPPNWRVAPEDGGAGKPVEFVMMPPGWHITTGPAALLFDPRRILEDRFTLATELFLFPESSTESYGLFVGGNTLEGAGARYLALQLRRDGTAGVLQRRNGQTSTLVDWKPIAAVGPHPGKDTQRITMSIEVDSTAVSFKANGEEVARLPRSGLDLAGHFGFRMGNGINVHVVGLDVTEKLAPPRRR
ncbi:MAG: hypothetical protein ACRENP_19785 [Longimicrobiales bacterium]